jgi:hypothetical protein
MKGWYKTSDGDKVILESTDIIRLIYKGIIELVIPNGVKEVNCSNNSNLTKLIIPDSVEFIYCRNNKLTKLDLPDGIKRVYCYNNQLTKLDIPDSVSCINCRYNQLTELIVPDNCIVECDPGVKIITRTMFNRSKRLKQILK